MFYNKDIFDQAGLPYPDETWDRKKFLEVAQKLTKDLDDDGKTDQFGFLWWGSWNDYFPIVWEKGGRILSKDKKEALVNTPEFISAVQFVGDTINKYKIAPSLIQMREIPFFETGKVAMHVNGYWMVSVYQKRIKNFSWDVAPLPRGEKGRVGILYGTAYSIASGSKHIKEAWELAKFLASPEIQELNVRKGLAIPALKTVATKEEILALPFVKIFVEAIDYSLAPPFNLHWNEMIDIMDRKIEAVYLNKARAEEIVEDLKTELDKLLSESEKRKI
jgi:multiple sugar transport system substrate-binding protein